MTKIEDALSSSLEIVEEEPVTIPRETVKMFSDMTETIKSQQENISALTALVERLTSAKPAYELCETKKTFATK